MHSSRKALCVGIDQYDNFDCLSGCVSDATRVSEILSRNADGTINFEYRLICATTKDNSITEQKLRTEVKELFSGDVDTALFYFAGHGAIDICGGYLCTSEVNEIEDGFSLKDLMSIVAKSDVRNKIIILDCCHSGSVGDKTEKNSETCAELSAGTTILTACGKNESASEKEDGGVFTSLLVDALQGGAADILGSVTPGSIYAYIDQSLGSWGQRPVFKANINCFVSLRTCNTMIDINDLRKIRDIFKYPTEEFKLDPSYESDKHEVDDKDLNKEHELLFSLLQKFVKLNLVVPVGEEHMYYAAIHKKSCKLTAKGQHYWRLIEQKRI